MSAPTPASSASTLAPATAAIVAELGLTPHPEGGFFRETFRGALELRGLPHGGPRAAHTAIYFLLPVGTFSALHVVRGSDEVWHFYDGAPLELVLVHDDGRVERVRLGRDLAARRLARRRAAHARRVHRRARVRLRRLRPPAPRRARGAVRRARGRAGGGAGLHPLTLGPHTR